MRSPIIPAVAVSGLAALCLTAVVACDTQGQQAPESSPSPTVDAPPPRTAPSPVDAAKEHATSAYVGMWQAMARAGRTSDWKSPELARYATGNALTTITRSLYADHFNHVVTRGAPKNFPKVTSVEPPDSPETVMISDCGDSTGTSKVMEKNGQPAPSDAPGGRRSIVAEVKKQPDGTWKVNQFAVQGVGTCS